jgi:inosine-uridine nucleoside N-ribohydrolase
MRRIPVVIDTDPGLGEPGSDIDDGLAIALALRSPELEVLALTIVNGNVDAITGTDVARRPDGSAASSPQGPSTTKHAADLLVELAAEHAGELVVIAIGPMTNLALAIERDPDFATNVRELVLMAGSATTYAQNITVVGDFNAYVDPEALDIVVRSGASIRMVGLDQTSRVLLTRADAEAMRTGSDPFGRWAAECTDAWIDFLGRAFPNRPEHRSACFLHDPLVVAAVTHPELLTWADAHVQVDTVSEIARGLVVADRGLALQPAGVSNAVVAVDTHVDDFRRLFLGRITHQSVAATGVPRTPKE